MYIIIHIVFKCINFMYIYKYYHIIMTIIIQKREVNEVKGLEDSNIVWKKVT